MEQKLRQRMPVRLLKSNRQVAPDVEVVMDPTRQAVKRTDDAPMQTTAQLLLRPVEALEVFQKLLEPFPGQKLLHHLCFLLKEIQKPLFATPKLCRIRVVVEKPGAVEVFAELDQ
jgi:hypothetical protein